jgi:hypothetical protein
MISEEEQLKEMRIEILEDSSDKSQDEIFKLKLKRAKQRYLRLVYPFNKEINKLPNERAQDWQTKCAIELYNLDGDENLTSYSETGLSESYAKAGLSQDLLNELPPPKAGVIS